jgi:hypothetical protein
MDLQGEEVTPNNIKKSKVGIGITAEEHLRGFAFLEPFLVCIKRMNPNFTYKIRVTEDGKFDGLAVVFQYAAECFNQNFLKPVIGLDVAHMKDIIVQKLPRTLLQKLFLSLFSARTLHNKMIFLSFALTAHENSVDLAWLHEVMIEVSVHTYVSIIILRSTYCLHITKVYLSCPLIP